MKKILTTILVVLISYAATKAQNNNSVGIGTLNPDSSAILHLESVTQGFLMTRLNTTQIGNVSTPAGGLIVFNTDDKCYWFHDSTSWKRLCNTDSLLTLINNLGDTIGYIYDSLAVHHTNITNNSTNINNNTTIIQNLSDSLGWVYDSLNVHNTNIYNLFDSINQINIHLGQIDSTLLEKWDLWGNAGTNPTLNFLGTTDAADLVFRTNSTEKVRITSSGNLGINTTAPTELLDVNGNSIRLRGGATNNFILTSNATGVGTWQNPANNPLITSLGNDWKLTGNSNATPGNNILGTLNNNAIDIRTSGLTRGYIDGIGNISFGHQNNITNTLTNGAQSYLTGANNSVSAPTTFVIGYSNTINGTSGSGGFYMGNNWNVTSVQRYNIGIGDGTNVDFLNQNGNVVVSTWDPGFSIQPTLSPVMQGQFVVRTNNGASIYSNGSLSAGVHLTSGSGTWASISDKNLKTNITALNYSEVLEKIQNLEITKWSYKSETVAENKAIKKDVYHYGVMAQDFYQTFGLGTSEKLITALDVGGVNMAAIKALIDENKALKERIEKIEILLQELQK